MRPVRQGETLDLYAGGDFSLGDRVAAVGDGGSPPFGARGYVVAVHGEACEVLFDREFVGGTDLHGVLPDKRGVLLPGAELVNLSHPPAMPLLGDAAPDRVVADKKGRVTKGGWDEKSARRKDAGGESAARPEPGGPRVPKGILAMAAALLPGKAGLPAGPGAAEHARARLARLRRRRGPRPRERRRGGASCPRAGQAHASAIVGSAVPAAAPAPDLGAMLAGANLKSMLMTGGGDAAETPPEPPAPCRSPTSSRGCPAPPCRRRPPRPGRTTRRRSGRCSPEARPRRRGLAAPRRRNPPRR